MHPFYPHIVLFDCISIFSSEQQQQQQQQQQKADK